MNNEKQIEILKNTLEEIRTNPDEEKKEMILSSLLDLTSKGLDFNFYDTRNVYSIGEEDTLFSRDFTNYEEAKDTFIEVVSNYNRMNIPEINKKKMQLVMNNKVIYEILVEDFSRMKAIEELRKIDEEMNKNEW